MPGQAVSKNRRFSIQTVNFPSLRQQHVHVKKNENAPREPVFLAKTPCVHAGGRGRCSSLPSSVTEIHRIKYAFGPRDRPGGTLYGLRLLFVFARGRGGTLNRLTTNPPPTRAGECIIVRRTAPPLGIRCQTPPGKQDPNGRSRIPHSPSLTASGNSCLIPIRIRARCPGILLV